MLQKTEEDLRDIFQRNCVQIIWGTLLTDRISNSRLYEKYGPVSLSRDIMRERLRWLEHVLRTKEGRLSSANRLGVNRLQSLVGVGGCFKERFKGNGNLIEGRL